MQHGQYHRTDGPAIEHKGTKQWWIDVKNLTEKDFNTYTKTRSDYNWMRTQLLTHGQLYGEWRSGKRFLMIPLLGRFKYLPTPLGTPGEKMLRL